MATTDGPVAVTTRSRLRGPWLFPAMVIGSRRVRRQLDADPNIVRWASVVAGPSEFWTISIWRNRHDLDEFSRSGAHARVLWLGPTWMRSFWAMRWRPGATELGRWAGLSFAAAPIEPHRVDQPTHPAALAQALAHLPHLRAATGPDGAAGSAHTVLARRERERVRTAVGVVVAVETAWRHWPAALAAVRQLRQDALRDPSILRVVSGAGRAGNAYLLAVWRDATGAERLLQSSGLRAAAVRFGPGCWAAEWAPESETGSWDGLRVRARYRELLLAGPGRRPRVSSLGAGRPRAHRG